MESGILTQSLAIIFAFIIICLLSYIIYDKSNTSKKKTPVVLTNATHFINNPELQKSYLMDNLGECEQRITELNEEMHKLRKGTEKDIVVNVTQTMQKAVINEKKKIVKSGIHLGVYPFNIPYQIIGIKGTNFGNLLSIVSNPSANKVWIYYRRGGIIDIVGGKPYNDVVEKIDNQAKVIYIRYDENGEFYPENYMED